MSKLLEAALEYGEAGISISPIIRNRKRPLLDGKQSFKSELDIHRFWDGNNPPNIGLYMGEASGLFGLDIDFKDGCEPNFMDRLPPTVHQRTPSGGIHAFFKWPQNGIKNGLALCRGVTVRSTGWLFVLAPSYFIPTQKEISEGSKEGFYEWQGRSLIDGEIAECPEWILEYAAEHTANPQPLQLPKTINIGQDGVGRQTYLWRLAGAFRAKGLNEDEIYTGLTALNASRCNPPLEEWEIRDMSKRAAQYVSGSVFAPWEIETEADETTVEEVYCDFPIWALGDLMAPVARTVAEKVSAPIEIVCSSLLASAALCVQEFFTLQAFGKIRPLSLFFITIAESGERKSTVDGIVLAEHNRWLKQKFAVYETERIRYKEDLENLKTEKEVKGFKKPKPVPPKAPILFVSEPTVEGLFYCFKHHRNSIGLFSDEGGTFLGGHSMKQENSKATLGKMNKLWDGSPIDRIRRGKDDGEVEFLLGKRISMHLMIQPKLAEELFNNEYARSQGFLARCLTCNPKSKIGGREFLYEIEAPIETAPFDARVRYFLDRKSIEGIEPAIISPTPEALALVKKFYYETEPQQKTGGQLSNIKDFASKIIEHCIRMAAVIEVFNNPESRVITEERMRGAIEIGKFYLGNQTRTVEKASIFQSKDHEVLYGVIVKRQEWKIRELLRHAPLRFRKRNSLMRYVKDLQKTGFCRLDEQTGTVSV